MHQQTSVWGKHVTVLYFPPCRCILIHLQQRTYEHFVVKGQSQKVKYQLSSRTSSVSNNEGYHSSICWFELWLGHSFFPMFDKSHCFHQWLNSLYERVVSCPGRMLFGVLVQENQEKHVWWTVNWPSLCNWNTIENDV